MNTKCFDGTTYIQIIIDKGWTTKEEALAYIKEHNLDQLDCDLYDTGVEVD